MRARTRADTRCARTCGSTGGGFYGTLNAKVWVTWKGAYGNVQQYVFCGVCVQVIPPLVEIMKLC